MGLSILEQQTESKELGKALTEVRQDVEAGTALSMAFGKHPTIFPPLMVNMTRAGEIGGFLDSVMLQIAANYEAEVKLRGKVKAAMTYPVVVFCMAILAVIGMLLFVVPTFAKLFSDLGGELPAPTRVLIFMSDVLKNWAPVLVVALDRPLHRLDQGAAHREVRPDRRPAGSSRCRSSAVSSSGSRWLASPATSAP